MTIWNRGLEYYRQGRVKEVSFNNQLSKESDIVLVADGIVEGREEYYPRIVVEKIKNRIIFHNFCTCLYFDENEKDCKHIAALAVALNVKGAFKDEKTKISKDELERIEEERKKAFENEFLNIISIDEDKNKKQLELHTSFYFRRKEYQGQVRSLEIKLEVSEIGGKKYKLGKKLSKFLDNYKKYLFNFGKNLEYSPIIHYFNKEDSRILDIANMVRKIAEGSYYREDDYLTNDGFIVPSTFIDEALELVKKRDKIYHRILGDEYLVNFNIEEADGDLVIKSNNLEKIEFFEDRGILVVDENSLTVSCYLSNREKIDKLKKLRELMSLCNFQIKIDSKNTEKTSKVIETISQISNVSLGEKIKEKIYIPKETKNKIYLDKSGSETIVLTLEEIYDGKTEKEQNKVILKDSKNLIMVENEIFNNNFYKDDNKYYLSGDEYIYKFMSEGINSFHNFAEIYYSENLKKMKYNKVSMKLSANLKDTGVLSIDFLLDGIDKSLLPEYIKSIKEKKRFFKLKDGSIFEIADTNIEELENILSVLNPSSSELKNGLIEREKFYSTFIKERFEKINGEVSKSLHDFSNKIETVEIVDIPCEFSMLRDYQKYGVQWLELLKNYGLGGILADDMGLGKTLQTIVYVYMNINKNKGPSIIITPKSLAYNWRNEFEKFAPNIKVHMITNSKKEREAIINNISENDVLITSYGVLQKDRELYNNIKFSNIIIDEAQAIKNPLSKTGEAVKSLKGDTKFALTGTPIENNLMELWSIFDFILPGYLGTHTNFNSNYIANNGMEKLKTLTHPFILRRLKKDVLKELPEKIETDSIVELGKEQKKLYVSYLSKAKQEIAEELKEVNEGQGSIKILSILTRLRQICAHPKLFVEGYKGESAKLELLMELLEECKESGHRVLLFSQFTEMLDIIKNELKGKFKYLYLDGKTPGKERIKLVDEFNSGDSDIFLISLKAGGTGLNLTGADTVIHFDPWWNPAVEDQATDRAYRMGQDRNVQVIKLVTAGTIEEKISKLKIEKKKIVEELFDGNQGNIFKLSKNELLDLLN